MSLFIYCCLFFWALRRPFIQWQMQLQMQLQMQWRWQMQWRAVAGLAALAFLHQDPSNRKSRLAKRAQTMPRIPNAGAVSN
ncbi:hypothetical protein [Flavobacterium sp.]|uniref:hypothetical protein n=1 Tax=Flavobacterium sp. TaxID=239 RepID=UPI00122B5C75|nr:hypothetical protein [Flavobacterium sp.]RZJ72882.1 MAG: hypothetical protein EOO49_04410 [Flavobacterium sp.]